MTVIRLQVDSHLNFESQTILDLMKERIEGINSPYTYFGMYRTLFNNHIEDQDLYSINVHCYGAIKCWYIIMPKYSYKFEKLAIEQILPFDSYW